jgi:mRNA interferase MazF
MKIKLPERGDILICDLSPTLGHEQKGNRPVLVLSASEFNIKSGLALICPITNTERGYFFEVKFKTEKTKGIILTHQIKTIDFKARRVKIVDKIGPEKCREVIGKIKILLEG